jgi:hypothetical protein
MLNFAFHPNLLDRHEFCPTFNRVRIYEFRRLLEALCKVIKPGQLGAWWDRPAPNFGGSTPLQVLERGEVDRLWRMVWEIRGGNSG